MVRPLTAAITAFLFVAAGTAQAQNIAISDAYVRSSTPQATSAAAFMVIENAGAEDDRLIAVSTEAAKLAELHSNSEDAMGVMRMGQIEDGLPVPAGEEAELARGGNHVMLMGLDAPLTQGETVRMILTFERAGEIPVDVAVDHERKPAKAAHGH